ncbi:MAG: hypothetical protein WCU88_04050 [Elusimicrobiota bacterium]|jgi:hypothetical protein
MIKTKWDADRCAQMNRALGYGVWVGTFVSAGLFLWVADRFGHIDGFIAYLFKRTGPLLFVEGLLGWLLYSGCILGPKEGP